MCHFNLHFNILSYLKLNVKLQKSVYYMLSFNIYFFSLNGNNNKAKYVIGIPIIAAMI